MPECTVLVVSQAKQQNTTKVMLFALCFSKCQGRHLFYLFGILEVCTTRNEFVIHISCRYEWQDAVSGCGMFLENEYIQLRW